MKIFTFDSTLRDGTQEEGVSFSVDEKLLVAQKLDEIGIDYIEGGWPGSNPKDNEFFARGHELKLRHARLTAFGSTRLAKKAVHEDPSVLALAGAGTPVVSIFGKTWDLHITKALGITLEQNLALIAETVRFLKDRGKEVVYDAEHFFDGFTANPVYALRALDAAKRSGADVLCLCDTNGGTLTAHLHDVVSIVVKQFGGVIGIHTHNDSELAVANSIAAVQAGAALVQGCLNGYGERCGNANLASIIANLELKLGHDTIGPEKLIALSSACGFVAEVANMTVRNDQPFVGKSAFAHKGGVHVSAVMKDSTTYEHVAPEAVGNRRRVLVSDLAGRASILYQLKQDHLADRLDEDARRDLLERIKQMEYEGYDLESAGGTFELLVRTALHPGLQFFDMEKYEVTITARGSLPLHTTAKVTLRAQDGAHSATASGHGPLNALHKCLRTCLAKLYPQIKEVHLSDFKVRLLDARGDTAARVRVVIRWSDRQSTWSTVGVSDNVVEASWNALLDAVRLELMRLAGETGSVPQPESVGARAQRGAVLTSSR
jgi:2-isopropylmalate synthase